MTELRDPEVAPKTSDLPISEPGPTRELIPEDQFARYEPPTINEQKPELAFRTATRPLLGPALWIAGATLWAYVVAGQFVLRARMPEVLGLGFVLGVLVTTAYVACERSLELLPARGAEEQRRRFVKPTWVGFVMAAGAVLVFSLIFSRAGDGLVMLLLLLSSLAAVMSGKRFTGRAGKRLPFWRRVLGVGLWLAALLLALTVVLSTVN